MRLAGNGIFKPVIIINGKIAGTWKRTEKKGSVTIETFPFAPLSSRSQNLVKAAAKKYVRFMSEG